MKRNLLLLAVVIVIVIVGWAIIASKKSGGQPKKSESVSIESIAPAFGSTGTDILITGTGFSSDSNDIGFNLKTPQVGMTSSYTTGYLSLVKSPDGKTLQFKLPEAVGVCAASISPEGTACPAIALVLPKEKMEIFVFNKTGTSNRVEFVIN